MSAQQYEELVVALACVSYGIVLLWRPDVFRSAQRRGRKRAWPIAVIVLGGLLAVQTVLGR